MTTGLLTKEFTKIINRKGYRDLMGVDTTSKRIIEIKSHEKLPLNKFIMRYAYKSKTFTKIITLESTDNTAPIVIQECNRNNNKDILGEYNCYFYDNYTMYSDDNSLTNYGFGQTNDIDNMIEILKTIS